ncbi:MAG: hypothetical protein ACJARE_003523, partial [Paracoccaceae bacterium]
MQHLRNAKRVALWTTPPLVPPSGTARIADIARKARRGKDDPPQPP